MCKIGDLSQAGVFYQNPDKKNELWMNFGWNLPNYQKYAPYHSCLEGQLSEANYNILVETLKKEFADPPYPNAVCAIASILCTLCTLGASFFYGRHLVGNFNARVEEALESNMSELQGFSGTSECPATQPESHNLTTPCCAAGSVRLEMTEISSEVGWKDKPWVDNNGKTLKSLKKTEGQYRSENYEVNMGPPKAYSLVITLPNAPAQWPPKN